MSIIVKQESNAFQPVTIVIDDVRTVNLLRFVVSEFLDGYSSSDIVSVVHKIDCRTDAGVASEELRALKESLVFICKP